AQLLALVGVPSPRLLHDADVDTHVDEGRLTADALAVRDLELRLAERRTAIGDHHVVGHEGVEVVHLDVVDGPPLRRLHSHDAVVPDVVHQVIEGLERSFGQLRGHRSHRAGAPEALSHTGIGRGGRLFEARGPTGTGDAV